ncbi:MAG: DUF1990 domain-containing protein [Saprospiraceae bacterium]|nr:DUF1990 domain-containing protein [Saprospiraceae bacterium]
MPALFAPTVAQTQAFLTTQTPLPFSYPGVGSTRQATAPVGFNHDFNTIELGQGEAVWAAAKTAIRQWRMFPAGWTNIHPVNTPICAGEVVAMTVRSLGIWWLNSCRIVYVLDNDRQFGFAYGTLPGHVERGEELFLVERLDDDRVIYSIRAFSQPRHWLARLGYPVARAFQRRFVRDSKAAMLQAVKL